MPPCPRVDGLLSAVLDECRRTTRSWTRASRVRHTPAHTGHRQRSRPSKVRST
ncbi:hypothetical protein ACWY4P_00850 [Streptomyces sp. LZ34]